MSQQTAVEWLIEKQMDAGIGIPKGWREQAKEMEKQQIMKAVYDGMGTNFDPNMGRAEEYFKQTYNK